ncbi:hypothetical protein [Longitalea luteola]|uniref:hypothetical protein n=1 Tax=Longitalea luteola TaxID=2812563 RepID=UPI001A97A3ED|nr:hypothetical protein [Longitalea luteola]
MRLPISTYLINRNAQSTDHQHLLIEFEDKKEFTITVTDSTNPEVDGIWGCLVSIISTARINKEKFILVCDDSHQFTADYSTDTLCDQITQADQLDADLLLGGVSWFDTVLPVTDAVAWINYFTGIQFMIIYERFYEKILDAKLGNIYDIEQQLSAMSSKIFIATPLLSIKKDCEEVPINNEETEATFQVAPAIKTIREVFSFYQDTLEESRAVFDPENIENLVIPTYVINLPERTERRAHIEAQFQGRDEFDVKYIEACRHDIGAVGLWLSIRKIIQMAIDNDDEVIIICEDDHEFSEYYTKEYLIKNIFEAHFQGADYLCGGSGGVAQAVPVTENRYWGSMCLSTQFIIVFRKFFNRILDQPFDDKVIADRFLSNLTVNKMVLYPFISFQKDFGYSDVTPVHHDVKGLITMIFTENFKKMGRIQKTYLEYYSHTRTIETI